jgi:hypothetical protein
LNGTFASGQPIYTRFALGHPDVMPDGRVVLPYRIDRTGNSAPGIIRLFGTAGTLVDSTQGGGSSERGGDRPGRQPPACRHRP